MNALRSTEDAKLVAAELTVKPARNAGGRKLRQLLDEWIDIKTPGWADLTIRDQTSRAKQVAADPIGNMSVASIGVSDVDRWVACLRKAGVGEGAIRNQHTVLRSALQQAVRWEWIATNPASSAPIASPKRQQQRTLNNDEVRAVITAAAEVHEPCVVHPAIDLARVEPHELADLQEGHAPLVDEPAHESGGDTEALGQGADVEQTCCAGSAQRGSFGEAWLGRHVSHCRVPPSAWWGCQYLWGAHQTGRDTGCRSVCAQGDARSRSVARSDLA